MNLESLANKILGMIKNPVTGNSISFDIGKIIINEKDIFVTIYGDVKNAKLLEPVRQECELRLRELRLFEKISVSLTSNPNPKVIPGVKRIITIASGKGGVGKSTIALHIALALAQNYKVGLIDSDIYGPSLPTLTGIGGKPELEENLMIPHIWNGIKLMSVGFLVNADSAAIWRGPMTTKVLYQLMRMTKWGELDYLIVDTPPGTGDVHLSLAENYKIDGTLIITTPQELATADTRKSIDMYKKLNIPILGMIENMSFFTTPDGSKHYIFGQDGAKKLSEETAVNILGQIPIYPEISQTQNPIPSEVSGLFNKIIQKGNWH